MTRTCVQLHEQLFQKSEIKSCSSSMQSLQTAEHLSNAALIENILFPLIVTYIN